MLPFILINIFVSATVVLAILFWWDNRQDENTETAAITMVPFSAPTLEATTEATSQTKDQPASAEIEAQDEQLTYVVQPGDTLGTISLQFDVLLVDLMEANGITDANFVNSGETLIIPSDDFDTPTPPPTETPSLDVVPSPIPTLPSEGEAVVEITGILDPGDIGEERVTIVNSGERQIDLTNWRLEDEQGHIFVFGIVTLFGNGVELVVHTRVGQSGLLDQFWGLNEGVWQPGETVLLRDAEGTIRARAFVE
jgi:LysM repeat protein